MCIRDRTTSEHIYPYKMWDQFIVIIGYTLSKFSMFSWSTESSCYFDVDTNLEFMRTQCMSQLCPPTRCFVKIQFCYIWFIVNIIYSVYFPIIKTIILSPHLVLWNVVCTTDFQVTCYCVHVYAASFFSIVCSPYWMKSFYTYCCALTWSCRSPSS